MSRARELSSGSGLALTGWCFRLPILPSPSPCGSGPSPLCPHPRSPGVESPSPVPPVPWLFLPIHSGPLPTTRPNFFQCDSSRLEVSREQRGGPVARERQGSDMEEKAAGVKAREGGSTSGPGSGRPRAQVGRQSLCCWSQARELLLLAQPLLGSAPGLRVLTGHVLRPQNRPTRALWLILKTRSLPVAALTEPT